MKEINEKRCGNCFYFNGDDEETQDQFCDEREIYVDKDNGCWRRKEMLSDD